MAGGENGAGDAATVAQTVIANPLDACEKTTNKELDSWVEQLYDCKQLTENQVRISCFIFRFS